MNQQGENERLLKLMEEYEKSLQHCSIREFRELRYKLKQVKEKLRSLKQSNNSSLN